MNEQINELRRKAALWCDENIPGEWSHESGYGEAWENKFAEFLIQDACKVMRAEGEQFVLDQNHGAVQGVGRCLRVVKTHFGVTE